MYRPVGEISICVTVACWPVIVNGDAGTAVRAPVVELIDVTGRRVARQSLTGLDPGEHEASVPLPGRVPAGVYFLRLMQAGQLRTAKLALLR